MKKDVGNPESRAVVNLSARPAFYKMFFFVNPTDFTSGVSTSATEEVAEYLARGYIEINMTHYPAGRFPPKITGGGCGGSGGSSGSRSGT